MRFKLYDKVLYPKVDNCPFTVVGIRATELEIEGDFSGGTHSVTQSDWVSIDKLKPYSDEVPEKPEGESTVWDLAREEFKNVPDDGLFPNHTDQDVWTKGFVAGYEKWEGSLGSITEGFIAINAKNHAIIDSLQKILRTYQKDFIKSEENGKS